MKYIAIIVALITGIGFGYSIPATIEADREEAGNGKYVYLSTDSIPKDCPYAVGTMIVSNVEEGSGRERILVESVACADPKFTSLNGSDLYELGAEYKQLKLNGNSES